MQKISQSPEQFFKVITGTSRSQIAEMVLGSGESTGSPNNKHSDSDQWMIVIEGNGEAVIDNETIVIRAGDILLIEAGENHEIRNTGENAFKTFNIYAPVEY